MSDITERNEPTGEGVNKEPVETSTVTAIEMIAEGIAEAAIETVTGITVETAVKTVVEKTGSITADEPTTSVKADSVHTEDIKRTEPSTSKEPLPTKQLNGPFIPKGKYALVSVDVDTTGRRLIDEVINNHKVLNT